MYPYAASQLPSTVAISPAQPRKPHGGRGVDRLLAAWQVRAAAVPGRRLRTDRKIPQRCHASIDGQGDQAGKDCVASLGSAAPGAAHPVAPADRHASGGTGRLWGKSGGKPSQGPHGAARVSPPELALLLVNSSVGGYIVVVVVHGKEKVYDSIP